MNVSTRVLGTMWGAIFAFTTVSTPIAAAVKMEKNEAKKPLNKTKIMERKHKSCSSSSSSSSSATEESSSSSSSDSFKKPKVWDYIVVGAGAAGSILARKLSDNKHKSVLVITNGENRNNDPEMLASPSDPAIYDVLWNVTNDPQYAETYDIKVFGPFQTTTYTEGTPWGGGASHNYMVAVRGTPDIYDSWAAISGNSDWSYSNMLPLMKALETYNPCGSFDSAERGSNGPISITQNPPVINDPLTNALNSVTTVGFIDDYNDATAVSTTGHHFVGYSAVQAFATLGNPACTQGVERSGVRSWSGREFLDASVVTHDGYGRHGRKLFVSSNSHANKVLLRDGRAIGVQYVVEKDGNQTVHNEYGREIILCAGAINSPAILERSGIGDPAVLGPLGIDVVVANSNVGNNLINQYGTTVITGVPTENFANQAYWNLAQSSPTFDPVYSYPDDDERRVQIDLLPFPIGAPFAGICQTFVLEPESVGSSHIVSRNPLVQPIIDLNMYSDGDYLTNGTDANKIVTALNLIASGVGVNNMFQPPGSLFSNPPGTDPAGDAALFNFVTTPDALQIEDHIIATTRMGTSIADGVVDGELNVFGVSHLKVADIGVLPVEPNGNTCYSAYMVALRCATILGVPVPPAL